MKPLRSLTLSLTLALAPLSAATAQVTTETLRTSA